MNKEPTLRSHLAKHRDAFSDPQWETVQAVAVQFDAELKGAKMTRNTLMKDAAERLRQLGTVVRSRDPEKVHLDFVHDCDACADELFSASQDE